MEKITAEELKDRFGLEKHPENGAFLENITKPIRWKEPRPVPSITT